MVTLGLMVTDASQVLMPWSNRRQLPHGEVYLMKPELKIRVYFVNVMAVATPDA